MAIGVVLLSAFQKKLPKVMIFTASVLGAGITLIVGASMSTLAPAFLAILGMGVFTGSVYVLGFTILHETVEDDLRGRTFSALYTLVRFCLLMAFALAPLLAGGLNRLSTRVFGGSVDILGFTVSLPGVRLALWLAGAIIVSAGLLAIHSLRSASSTGRTRDL